MSDCIFCGIIDGRIPSRRVYEDDRIVAFWDVHPASPIHILIVPKNHIPTLNDIPENDQVLAHVGAVAKTIAEQLGVDQSGYRLFINVNRGGGQRVFHLHAHLVAGNDLGSLFIRAAIVCAVLWRKLMGLLRPPRQP